MDYVIIVAGGKGLRMGSDIPKQFLPIGGLPVLMRTLNRFWEYSADLQIILVLPKEQQDYWRSLCDQYHFPIPSSVADGKGSYLLADGGATRFHSVQNGLALIPDDAQGVVGVHDGVRPFVTVEVIHCCYEEARLHQAVIPVIPVVETLRKIGPIGPMSPISPIGPIGPTPSSHTVPRSDYRLVQTPQVFDIQLLKAANRAANTSPVGPEAFTDDASVVEAFGFDITLVEGNRENIKLTTPFDIAVAETIQHSTFNIQH